MSPHGELGGNTRGLHLRVYKEGIGQARERGEKFRGDLKDKEQEQRGPSNRRCPFPALVLKMHYIMTSCYLISSARFGSIELKVQL